MEQVNNSCWKDSGKKRSKPLPEPCLLLKGTKGACRSPGECVSHYGEASWRTSAMVSAGGGDVAAKEYVAVVWQPLVNYAFYL